MMLLATIYDNCYMHLSILSPLVVQWCTSAIFTGYEYSEPCKHSFILWWFVPEKGWNSGYLYGFVCFCELELWLYSRLCVCAREGMEIWHIICIFGWTQVYIYAL